MGIAHKRLRHTWDVAERRTKARLAEPESDSSDHNRDEQLYETAQKRIRLATTATERAEAAVMSELDVDTMEHHAAVGSTDLASAPHDQVICELQTETAGHEGCSATMGPTGGVGDPPWV